MNVTLGFRIELAKEFTGDILKVLRDHEYGHVTLGKDQAQTHLVDTLRTDLEALPDFTAKPPIQNAFVRAGQRFAAAEGNASQAYDNVDYPRMREAYIGAQTPLAKLESSAPRIAATAKALRTLNTRLPGAKASAVSKLAQAAIDTSGALADDEMARLQYNPEFKQLVQQAQSTIDAYLQNAHWNLLLVEFSTLSESIRNKLDELKLVLQGFTWQPPV